jgi:hypothetical protein
MELQLTKEKEFEILYFLPKVFHIKFSHYRFYFIHFLFVNLGYIKNIKLLGSFDK